MDRYLQTLIIIFIFSFFISCLDQKPKSIRTLDVTLNIPERNSNSLKGSGIIPLIKDFDIKSREDFIYSEIISGNIPDFIRNLKEVIYYHNLDNEVIEIKFYVMIDYFSIGSNEDYFVIPMTPIIAQKLANNLELTFLTSKMVDIVWNQAPLKLQPITIPPSEQMTSFEIFGTHNELLNQQRVQYNQEYPLGTLLAGTKKDIILSNILNDHNDRVIIYGWHQTNGIPIQPVYSGHIIWYVDYSHGVRFAHPRCLINGEPKKITDILKDNNLFFLLSNESTSIQKTSYQTDLSFYP